MVTLQARLAELIGKPERPGMLAALTTHYEKKLQPLVQLERDVAEVAGVVTANATPDMLTFWRDHVIYEYRRAGSHVMHYRLRSDFADQEDFYNFRMEIQEEFDQEENSEDDYGPIFPRRYEPDDVYQ